MVIERGRGPITGLALLGLVLCAACAAEDPPHGIPAPANPGGGGSGAGTPTGTTTGQGGMGEGGMGGAGGAEPENPACVGDFAFRADAMTFVDPTPTDLASALNEHIGPEDHPITLVLRSSSDAPVLGTSFAMEAGPAWKFLPPLTPTFTEAMVESGSFKSMAPAAEGFVRIRHDEGVLDLAIVDVQVDALTELDCGLAEVTLDATIPAALRDETMVGSQGETTLGELAGGDDGDIPVTATFTGTSISFDFDSLE